MFPCKPDVRAKYEVVLEVVQNLHAAGVDQLGLLTEQIQGEHHPTTDDQKKTPGGSPSGD